MSQPITSDSDMEISTAHFEEKAKRRNSTGPKYFCSTAVCGASFTRLDHLDRHEFHHTGVRKHACSYDGCEKSYTILAHLKRHLRTTHERPALPTKSVPCIVDDCKKLFQSTSNMQRHFRYVHENRKVYACSYCDEIFERKMKMRRHEIKKHTGVYPYKCDKCTRGFYQQWHYDRHVPACKVYPCPTCDHKFDKWTLYQQHCKKTQHGRKYYKCEYCVRTYRKPGELQKHVAAKHLTDTGAEPFKCPHDGCNRFYNYERNLNQHIITAHTGKRYACVAANCSSVFSSSQNLSKHINRVHGAKSTVVVNGSKQAGARKKRKDAGKSKISILAQLSGIAVDKGFDELLRERDSVALSEVAKLLAEQPVEELHDNMVTSEEEETMGDSPKITILDKDTFEMDTLLFKALQEVIND